MSQLRCEENWSYHLDHIIRSRHYTRLAEGLGGEPLDKALQTVMTDIMHICARTGLPFEQLVDASSHQFEGEARKLNENCHLGAA